MGMTKRRALEIINDSARTKTPFSIEFVSADITRRTGGDLKVMKNMISSGANHDQQKHGTITIKPKSSKGHPIPVHINLIMKLNESFVL